MEKMDEYLERLQSYFDEEDLDAFNELKEDLLEQLSSCLAEGQTEEEAVAHFSPPEEVVEDYFLDRSFEAAREAKTYVVPKEQVGGIFFQAQKTRLKKGLHHLIRLLVSVTLLGLVGIFIYSCVYIYLEAVNDHHWAAIPSILALLSLAGIIQLAALRFIPAQKRKFSQSITIFLLISAGISAIFFQLNDGFFYTGESYYQSFQLTENEAVSFAFHSGADIEVITVETAKTDPFSFIIRGSFKKSDIQTLESQDYGNNIDVSLDKKNVFDVFTRTGKSQLIFFMPKGHMLTNFYLDMDYGDLRLLDLNSDQLELVMKTGDVYAKNIKVAQGKIISETGDVVIEESQGNLQLDSQTGKTVMTHHQGDLAIDVVDGVSILKQLQSENVSLDHYSSRLVLEDSDITKLTAKATDGQLVVKHTNGTLFLENQQGKIVSEENAGQLTLLNDSGPTISVQTTPVNAEVRSSTGFIKWLQGDQLPVQISAVTSSKDLRNEFSSETADEPQVKISSDSGSIKVLKKVD